MASSINVLRCPNPATAAALPSSSGSCNSKGLLGMNVVLPNESSPYLCSLQYTDKVEALGLGTLSAETIPSDTGFPPNDDEFDLDQPSEGFASIPEAVEDIRKGKGMELDSLCYSMKGDDLERLELPLMVTQNENEEKLQTAFTISVI